MRHNNENARLSQEIEKGSRMWGAEFVVFVVSASTDGVLFMVLLEIPKHAHTTRQSLHCYPGRTTTTHKRRDLFSYHFIFFLRSSDSNVSFVFFLRFVSHLLSRRARVARVMYVLCVPIVQCSGTDWNWKVYYAREWEYFAINYGKLWQLLI